MKFEVTSYVSEDQGAWVRPFNCLKPAPGDATDAELEWHIIRLDGLRSSAGMDPLFYEKISVSIDDARKRLMVA